MAFFKSADQKRADEMREHLNSDESLRAKEQIRSSLLPLYRNVTHALRTKMAQRNELAREVEDFGQVVAVRRDLHSEQVAKKFRYLRVATSDPEFSYEYIDILGRKGWELVTSASFNLGFSTNMTVHFEYFFKQQISELPEDVLAELGDNHTERQSNLAAVEAEVQKLRAMETEIVRRVNAISPLGMTILDSLTKEDA